MPTKEYKGYEVAENIPTEVLEEIDTINDIADEVREDPKRAYLTVNDIKEGTDINSRWIPHILEDLERFERWGDARSMHFRIKY